MRYIFSYRVAADLRCATHQTIITTNILLVFSCYTKPVEHPPIEKLSSMLKSPWKIRISSPTIRFMLKSIDCCYVCFCFYFPITLHCFHWIECSSMPGHFYHFDKNLFVHRIDILHIRTPIGKLQRLQLLVHEIAFGILIANVHDSSVRRCEASLHKLSERKRTTFFTINWNFYRYVAIPCTTWMKKKLSSIMRSLLFFLLEHSFSQSQWNGSTKLQTSHFSAHLIRMYKHGYGWNKEEPVKNFAHSQLQTIQKWVIFAIMTYQIIEIDSICSKSWMRATDSLASYAVSVSHATNSLILCFKANDNIYRETLASNKKEKWCTLEVIWLINFRQSDVWRAEKKFIESNEIAAPENRTNFRTECGNKTLPTEYGFRLERWQFMKSMFD